MRTKRSEWPKKDYHDRHRALIAVVPVAWGYTFNTHWKENMKTIILSLYSKIARELKRRKTRRDLYRYASSLQDMSIAHYNNKLPLTRHLEEFQNQSRKINNPDSDLYKNLSPIPRHDLSEFNKLTTVSDLYKRHPNPKMEGSPFVRSTITSNNLEKYEILFTRIFLNQNNQDES